MKLQEQLLETPVPWTYGNGSDSDVVVSTRVRLARNFEKQRFPLRQDNEEAMQVWKHLSDFAQDHPGYRFYRLDTTDDLDKQALLANHLISPVHAVSDGKMKALVLKDDFTQAIMVNEEDHLRMQTFQAGFASGEAWQQATALDNQIAKYGAYAFDKKLGYLTSCPTNLGTGMRISVMLHLPAMVASRQMTMLEQVSKMGMAVRGFYGEGTEASGNLYQLSNQVTLGQSEEEILSSLSSVTKQIVAKERSLRQQFLKQGGPFEDQCYRALGTLAYARALSGQETYQLLSTLRLGVSLGVIKGWNIGEVDPLLRYAHPGFVQFVSNKTCDENERDVLRATLLRNKIDEHKGGH